MTPPIFKNKKLNVQKLIDFGFAEADGGYIFRTLIAYGHMEMTVSVAYNENVSARICDADTGEEYVLHRVPGAVGEFVGKVKEEYEATISHIAEKCFEPDVFKSEQAVKLIAHVREKYGDELEFLWQKFPDNAVWRRKDNAKWYATLLTVPRRKLGQSSNKIAEILDLRMKPDDIERMVDGEKYFPGYHMNKKHWITVCLDGTVSFEEICARLDESFILANK